MNASVDISKIKPGDEVTVRLTVKRYGPCDYRGLAYVVCEGGYKEDDAAVIVLADRVVSHTPKALSVGDRVKIGMPQEGDILWTGKTARIVALDGNDAWLASEHGDHLTVGLHRLGRA